MFVQDNFYISFNRMTCFILFFSVNLTRFLYSATFLQLRQHKPPVNYKGFPPREGDKIRNTINHVPFIYRTDRTGVQLLRVDAKMEVNKDEAQRCIDIALLAFKAGNLDKARKFVDKSKRLFPMKAADDLQRLIQSASSGPSSARQEDNAGPRRRPTANKENEKPQEPKLNVDYTQEQLDVVKRLKKCKDYYEVLGVTKEATDSEIKKAYKKLALQLHPDKNKAPGSVEAFKALGNAVATLTDAQKRKDYDLYGNQESTGGHHRPGYAGGAGHNHHYEYSFGRGFESDINPNDLFNMFFGGGFPPQQHQRGRARWQSQESNSGSQPSLIFGLVLCFIVVSMLSTFFASDPLYSLQQTP